MRRFLYVSLGTLFIALLGVLFGSSYASAASPIDNFITTTDKLILSKISGPDLDATLFWYDYTISAYEKRCENYPSGTWCDIADWLIDQKDTENFLSGSWLVTKVSNDIYAVFWSNVENSTCDLSSSVISGGRINYFCEANQFFFTTIHYDPDNNNSSDIGVYTNTSSGVINLPSGMVNLDFYDTEPVFFSTFKYIFPPGYEGEIPPDTIGDPLIERQVIAPDFEYDYNDFTINAKDHVNDLIPEFTPDEGYTSNGPEVRWTIWKCSTEWVKGVCPSGDSEIINLVTKPLNEGVTWTVEEYGFYKIEAEYTLQQCYRYASYPATPDHCFNASLVSLFGNEYLFERRSKDINLDGLSGSGDTLDENCDIMGACSTPGSITGGMLQCFTKDFPFVEVSNCVTNVFWIVDSLTFSKVTMFGMQSNTLECKQLSTVGAWINTPNMTVCPMFPPHVRDVVTPFVTFAFVLMLAGFLMRLGRG